MKRFLTMCALAMALLAAAEQQASAWSKYNYSVGLNVGWERADNSFGWGLYRNGPHPFAQNSGPGYGGDYPISEPMPHASMPMQQQPMLPAPMQSQGVAPASYWAPSYYWIGN